MKRSTLNPVKLKKKYNDTELTNYYENPRIVKVELDIEVEKRKILKLPLLIISGILKQQNLPHQYQIYRVIN